MVLISNQDRTYVKYNAKNHKIAHENNQSQAADL